MATDIAVFTMEKVGSSTLLGAIRSAGLDAHRIYLANLAEFRLCEFKKIITAVRDPIARNISAKFEFARNTIEDDMPLEWFDKYILPILHVDVFAEPFDKDAKWQTYDDRLLVIRTCDLNSCIPEALEEFLGIDPEKVSVVNKGHGRKKFGPQYTEFVKNVTISQEYLNRMYSSKYMRHFYTEIEIAEFTRKWLHKEGR